MKKFYAILLSVFSIMLLGACKTDTPSQDLNVVYATNLEISQQEFTCEVGTEINLSTYVTITPSTVQYQLLSSNTSVVQVINNTVLSCVGVGTCQVSASVQAQQEVLSTSVTINVTEAKIYANLISFDYNTVTINYNETQINNSQITLENSQNLEFAQYLHKLENSVVYSQDNIINYNPTTGVITPLGFWDQTKTVTVSVSVLGREGVVTRTFNVTVTSNVYAGNLTFDGIYFNTIENIDYSQPITLFTNSEFLLEYESDVDNFNMYPLANVESGDISFENSSIITGSSVGQAQLKISLPTSQTTTLVKYININIVKPVTQLTIMLTDTNYVPVTDVYVSNEYMYKLVVSANAPISYSELQAYLSDGLGYYDFYELQPTQVANEFNIRFTSAGNLLEKVALAFENTNFDQEQNFSVVSNSLNVNVYNAVTSINHVAMFEDSTISQTTANTYDLYLINSQYSDLAIADNVPFYAEIGLYESGSNYKPNNYQILVNSTELNELVSTAYANVTLQNGKLEIQPIAQGVVTIVVNSNDYVGYTLTIVVNIQTALVTSIQNANVTGDITLYTNTTDAQYNTFDLTSYVAYPLYAVNRDITFTTTNEFAYVNMQDLTLIANTKGQDTLLLSCPGFQTSVNVSVESALTSVLVGVQSNELSYVDNTQVLNYTTFEENERITLKFMPYGEDTLFTNVAYRVVYVNDQNQEMQSSVIIDNASLSVAGNLLILDLVNSGIQKLQYNATDGINTITGYILITKSPYAVATNVTFNKLNDSINTYETLSYVNNYVVSYDNNNAPKNDQVLFSLSDTTYATIDQQTGVITFDEMLVSGITTPITLTVTLTIVNGEFSSSYTYELTATYELIYDQITSIAFENSSITINKSGTEDLVVTNNIIINNGNSGVYDLSELMFNNGAVNCTVLLDQTTLTLTISGKIENGIITVFVANGMVENSFALNVTTYTPITTQQQLEGISGNGEYALANNLTISGTFETISLFNGYLSGNGYTIYGLNAPLFDTLTKEANIVDLTMQDVQINNLYNGNEYASGFVIKNYGTISNVTINTLTITSEQINLNNVSAFVYENYGDISNILITNANLVNFKNFGGFVYYNYANISDVELHVTLTGSTTARMRGFAYTVSTATYEYEGVEYTVSSNIFSNTSYVVFSFTATKSNTTYLVAFVDLSYSPNLAYTYSNNVSYIQFVNCTASETLLTGESEYGISVYVMPA